MAWTAWLALRLAHCECLPTDLPWKLKPVSGLSFPCLAPLARTHTLGLCPFLLTPSAVHSSNHPPSTAPLSLSLSLFLFSFPLQYLLRTSRQVPTLPCSVSIALPRPTTTNVRCSRRPRDTPSSALAQPRFGRSVASIAAARERACRVSSTPPARFIRL